MTARAGAAGALVALAAGCLTAGCERTSDALAPAAMRDAEPAAYVGGEVCAACHAEEAGRWRGSHHDRAFAVATPATVLGDFRDATFTYAGITSTFFMRGGDYWVNTDGPDGTLTDYRVTHTIGAVPLQQYLIAFADGRFQTLSIAWDTRPVDEGGQRWFHLYPDEAVTSGDPLHWTGTYQRWNTNCATCHSTDLVKHFTPDTGQFATTWASIDVDCEACHGPGSAHAAAPASARLGLGYVERAWVFDADRAIARRVPEPAGAREVEVCAQCHSRRSQLVDEHAPGEPFLDAFRPTLLDAGLYYADGQILDEVYVYGSFRQSAMANAGVTCSDCHDPHSGLLRATGNALCAQCHRPDVFDTRAHHRHDEAGPGAQCVGCHMRAKTYMVVDPRRDHSFRVPRPDLSVSIGSPNACNDCHADRTPAWAAQQVAGWYPGGRGTQPHYGEALYAGRRWAADAGRRLQALVADPAVPAIARATAISLLSRDLDDTAIAALERALADPDPLVALAAVDGVRELPMQMRADLVQRFLTHPLRALRIAAAQALLGGESQLSSRRQQDLAAATQELMAANELNGDRAEGLLAWAEALTGLGRQAEAERIYRLALAREPGLPGAYVNLADFYRSTGREREALETLRAGLERVPGDAGLSLALGLALVRSGSADDALPLFEQAVEAAPDEPYYAYVLGVALASPGAADRATAALRAAHERFPGYRAILVALATMLRDAGDIDAAYGYARELVTLAPADATARALVAELEAAGAR